MNGIKYELIGDCKVAVLNNITENLNIARKIAAFKDSQVTIKFTFFFNKKIFSLMMNHFLF